MAIIINLDVVMAQRKIKSKDLAKKMNITEANLSIIKTGKVKALKITTLDLLCEILDCKPGDLLIHEKNK